MGDGRQDFSKRVLSEVAAGQCVDRRGVLPSAIPQLSAGWATKVWELPLQRAMTCTNPADPVKVLLHRLQEDGGRMPGEVHPRGEIAAADENAGEALLELAELQGARVFNRPAAVRSNNEKLAITQFPQFIAPTLVTSDDARIRAFHAEHRDIILKPLDGMGGAGIFRVRDDAMNLGAIIETLTANGRTTIMVQRFIPAIEKGDKRILLIGGAVVPFCLARIPQGGEVRGNLAAGGLGVAQPISARDREIAEALAPLLAQRGLLLVGLDVIGDFMTEINVTSPTCFQEITQQTGFNVPALFMDAVEKAV